MNHKQLLNHLAAEQLVRAMEYDVSKLTSWAMLGPASVPHETVQTNVISKFFRRWNCACEAPETEVTEVFRRKAWIAAAVTLHKYGFCERRCTECAIEAIDKLNSQVALSDYFSNHLEQAKSLIQSAPVPLKKRPPIPDDITFWRARDVVSYLLDGRYYALYIHDIRPGNTVPLVEFFNIRLDRSPTASDIVGLAAVGGKYNDGIRRIEKYWVHGMRNNPDMANQFRLVQSDCDGSPSKSHLAPAVGKGTITDIFRLPDYVERLFSE